MKNIQLLDCTLRDGAYIVDANFGAKSISGIIKKLQEAKVDIIECGWLKDGPHQIGTSFYHVPNDLKHYMIVPKNRNTTYVAMIDYNRYNIHNLPDYDGQTIDAIRIVFPKDKMKEGIELVRPIKEKGYKVFLQASNTWGYSDYDLLTLVDAVNIVGVEALSIVDTFGAMYSADLQRILLILNNNLCKNIKLGFHSHNNQQLSFALTMQFIETLSTIQGRNCIVDSSLCGMGRGAGNAPTELVAGYLNRTFFTGYDMNIIMDIIDVYMSQYLEKFKWGYSIPYMIAGTYACHVNNVAYLTKTHRTKSKDMKIIFDSMDANDRTHYDYDYLEKVYADYQNKVVNDAETKDYLKQKLADKTLTIILPGKTAVTNQNKINKYIHDNHTIVIGINAVVTGYKYDYLFFSNELKYDLAKENHMDILENVDKIITSNIKTVGKENEYIINYNDLQKRGWTYYDNSMIMFLRLMSSIMPKVIAIAGFDGYHETAKEKYADELLQPPVSQHEMDIMQMEIIDMLKDFIKTNAWKIDFKFITPSVFEDIFKK